MKYKQVRRCGILIASIVIITIVSATAIVKIKRDNFSNIQGISAEKISEDDYKVIGSDHLKADQEYPDNVATDSASEPNVIKTYNDVEFVALPVDMNRKNQEEVFRICQEDNIAFPLVMAIIEHESQFDTKARSQTGDSGLMQINDVNAKTLADQGYIDLYSLQDNVSAGIYLIQELYCKYGDTTFVLMAYNAGETGAKKQQKEGITETDYTKEIESRAEEFTEYIDERLK